MGKTMTAVSFWNADMKVSEVIEASDLTYFNVRNLKAFSKNRYSLYTVSDGTFYVKFTDGSFFVFK